LPKKLLDQTLPDQTKYFAENIFPDKTRPKNWQQKDTKKEINLKLFNFCLTNNYIFKILGKINYKRNFSPNIHF